MDPRRLICVGGTHDRTSICLVVNVDRVFIAKSRTVAIPSDNQLAAHKPDNEEYTVRRVSFPDGNTVEVLGPFGWSDFKVFHHLAYPE